MRLSTLDWSIVFAFFLLSLLIGLLTSRKSGQNSQEFFLAGRSMPWWLLGISMVATTFSADTPNLVTDMVRKNGVAGNWAWWAFLLTGMLTVFVYAKLWRRSALNTDLEFYELRYEGKAAAFLRGFRAIYLGVFFNVVIMATVCLAAIKIGGVMLNLQPWQTLLIASVITVVYSAGGGLRGVLITDFFQFIIAMVGSIGAAIYIINLPEIGGLTNLLAQPIVSEKLTMIPDPNNKDLFYTIFIIPIAVQWWSVWYPGAEPGGGGYIAQRMFAAKNENNAMGATLLFNIFHYALRSWPWILVALASLILFPTLDSLKIAFPNLPDSFIRDDLAYSAALTYLPSGLLGLVVASLIAAFMSTISTQLNWGSSYIVYDWYIRFIRPDATEKELVNVGRISTFVLMALAVWIALGLESALQAFNILLQIGAGTGLLFILRWFWWRINAYSELTAMLVSFAIALYFQLIHNRLGFPALENYEQLIIGVVVTTFSWLLVTFISKPTKQETLVNFYKKVKPAAFGWKKVLNQALKTGELQESDINVGRLPMEILGMFIGCVAVYGALGATGYWIYGQTNYAWIATIVTVVAFFVLFRIWMVLQKHKV
jgi:Na+/proline symporter